MASNIRKRALITGGSKGIGYAVASVLAQAGYDIIITYASDETAAASACRQLSQSYHTGAFAIKADITEKESIEKIYKALIKDELLLDAVVFNAGLTCRDSLEDMKMDDWERVFFGNIHFPVFLLQRIISLINHGGAVVFTGSAMGIHPHAVSLSYGVTKSAVHAMVKNLMKSLAPHNIRVNAVAPGFVDTDWQKNKPVEIRKNIENKIALGRFSQPEEVAEVYKMAIENQYLNGEIIVVDGGYSYK